MSNTFSPVKLDCPQGALLGEVISPDSHRPTDPDVGCFKGIPYALPPVGVRRWKPAEPAPPWDGVRVATEFAPQCPQPSLPESTFYYTPSRPSSEDCLYLNIWAPLSAIENSAIENTENNNQKRPVMVWIHGGSLVDGSGSWPSYDGTGLARKGVVMVTLNYRLNVFGYFCHPELSAESSQGAAGNYGITDQIQALKWVQENISAFGGDPDRVTIFGESAGALSVSHLLASPLAAGLFQGAIMQSGYLPKMPTLSEAEQTGVAFAESAAQCLNQSTEADQLAAFSLDELRALPADTLLSMARDGGFYQSSETARSVLDGWVFDAQVYEIFEQGRQQNVPILVGYNSGESTSFAGIDGLVAELPKDAQQYLEAVGSRYGEFTEAYLKQYPPEDLPAAVFGPATDGFYGWAAERFARMTESVGNRAFLYYFDQVPAWCQARGLGAFHALELCYMFNHIEQYQHYKLPNWGGNLLDEADVAVADAMSDYWVAFAHEGVPRVEDRPTWLPYSEGQGRHYMSFSQGCAEPGTHLRPGMFELHEAIIERRRQTDHSTWWLSELGLLAPESEPVLSTGDANGV